MYIFRNYGDLFGGLFTPKTKGDRILFKIGAISGLGKSEDVSLWKSEDVSL